MPDTSVQTVAVAVPAAAEGWKLLWYLIGMDTSTHPVHNSKQALVQETMPSSPLTQVVPAHKGRQRPLGHLLGCSHDDLTPASHTAHHSKCSTRHVDYTATYHSAGAGHALQQEVNVKQG